MFVDCSGTKTHFQTIGDGLPVFMLHGWGHDWQTWSPVVTTLSEQFQIIMPDLPAFGSTQINEIWDLKNYTAWLHEFITLQLEATQQSSCILLGHSFGGKIAAAYTAGIMDDQTSGILALPKALILVDSAGLPDQMPISTQLKQQLVQLVPSALKSALPLSWKQQILSKTGMASDYLQSTPLQKKILQTTIRDDLSSKLHNITVPTLIIWGENDIDTPVHQAERFHQGIAKSNLVVFPGVGHFPYAEQPSLFINTLTEFLQNQEILE